MTIVARMAANIKVVKERRKRKQPPSHALKASLRQARAQKRLTIGFNSSINTLKRNPENIMVCLCLQKATASGKARDEAVCNIQHMLLQAFCAESRIHMVRITADASLMRLVQQLAHIKKGAAVSNDSKEDASDCCLLLIEFPAGSPSAEDVLWLSACEDGHLDIQAASQVPSD